MDANIIIEALEMLKARGGHTSEKLHYINRLLKDAEDFRRLSYFGISDGYSSGRINFVSTGLALDAMNIMTYDIFGKLARKYGPKSVPLYEYTNQVHYLVDKSITPSIIEESMCFLQDLWQDNEEAGANREDGTFDK